MAEHVTVDNFVRAESDTYFRNLVDDGGWLRFHHIREPSSIDHQTVVRLNRDTLYSSIVVDLDAGPLSVTLPDSGERFMSLAVINEDHYVQSVVYTAGTHTYTRDDVETRYAVLVVRTLVDPVSQDDLQQVHSLQDAIGVTQAQTGSFVIPEWDAASQKVVRDALLTLGKTLPSLDAAFGTKERVDPVHHLIGSAMAWGGNPDEHARYLNVIPEQNDGSTRYQLTVKDVPVDGFWSISVYDAQGYYVPNSMGAYSLNSLTAAKDADGSVSIRFGDFDGMTTNCLPITPGWNYMVRLYRPRAEILDGTWMFPAAQPAD